MNLYDSGLSKYSDLLAIKCYLLRSPYHCTFTFERLFALSLCAMTLSSVALSVIRIAMESKGWNSVLFLRVINSCRVCTLPKLAPVY